ncbi:MAG: hypothetical protein DWP98_07240 [Bacteroidetes bacterium]|nr:MAG: hypothetical protein DWP98_07240 [Bacteroidota bacterium]MBL1145582.1 hypothetical protein [Bacteroidota bacterium]NOG58378.1 OmpA family protein [Bacteroidota bacterium]
MEFKHSKSQIHQYTLKGAITLIASLFLFVSCNKTLAQSFSSEDKKAIKLFEAAKENYDKHQLAEAEENLKKAIEKDPRFVEAHTLIAYIYLDQGKYESAKTAFENACQVNALLIPNNLFFLAELELKEGEYAKAKKHLTQFISTNPRDPSISERTDKNLAICEFGIESMNNPVPFNPINLGAEINSEHAEYFPCLTVDEDLILFTRRLPFPNSPQGFNEDFYVSTKSKTNEWTLAKNLGKPINTENNEGAPSLSADGQLLFFTACELYGDYGGGRKGFGSCDLFYTLKNGDNWEQPSNVGKTLNSPHWETQPSFSADGKTLYFIRGKRTRSGSRTGDIYVTELGEDGYWKTPSLLSPMINTSQNEESVFIHPDGKTLYFSSDGHIGMGGLDIFKTVKQDDGTWSKPINLGYPINTHKNENSLLVSADGNSAYFASDREGGFGDLDLYKFELPENLKPNPVSYFKGRIFDRDTKESLNAKFELIDLETGNLVVESYSNPGNGEFLISLPTGKDYALNASKKDYLFYSENFSLSNKKNEKALIKNVPMQKIKVGETIVLKNIFFETGKFELKPQSLVELNKLVDFLKANPNLKIEVSGHTDTVGNKDANLVLSDNRAKSVQSYLVQKGIELSRLESVGFGSSKPISSNDNETGRAQNRRTEFKIIGL